MIKFANNLKLLRESRHLTQEQLAKQFNVGRTTISNWELGERSPKTKDALKLADFFGVDIDEMLTGDVFDTDKQIVLSANETDLVEKFRKLNESQKSAVLSIIESMVK